MKRSLVWLPLLLAIAGSCGRASDDWVSPPSNAPSPSPRAGTPAGSSGAIAAPRAGAVPSSPAAPPKPGGTRVQVRGLETEDPESPVVLLGTEDGSLLVPIRIGPSEALAIAFELAHHPRPRPLTHDLIGRVLEETRASLESVSVTEVRDGTVYASLALAVGPRHVEVDSRPSDAIALALRLNVPIYVSAEVLGVAGIRKPGAGPATATAHGITVQPLTSRLAHGLGAADGIGVLVADVAAPGPATSSGLLPGDVLVSLGGKHLLSVEDFRTAGATLSDEATFEVEYERESRRLRAQVKPRRDKP